MLTSSSIPWKMATGITSGPEKRVMTGRTTSMELTPAAVIGARRPKYFRNSGAPTSDIISRKILASKAIVPNSVASLIPMLASFSCTISTEDNE